MDARGRLIERAGLWVTIREVVAHIVGRRVSYAVQGESMRPTLLPGDHVWVRPCPLDAVPDGAVVVLEDARAPGLRLVKRLRSRGHDTFAVGSDNPQHASDSRELGSFPSDALLGLATLVLDANGGRWRPRTVSGA